MSSTDTILPDLKTSSASTDLTIYTDVDPTDSSWIQLKEFLVTANIAQLNELNEKGQTPLMCIVSWIRGHRHDALRILLNRNVDVNIQDNQGLTALDLLIDTFNESKCSYSVESVHALLVRGAKPLNALVRAIKINNDYNRYLVVKLLLSHGADPNVTIKNESILFNLIVMFFKSPYHYYCTSYAASRNRHIEKIVVRLLKVGANPNVVNSEGKPLFVLFTEIIQSSETFMRITGALLDAGLDPNLPYKDHHPFLMLIDILNSNVTSKQNPAELFWRLVSAGLSFQDQIFNIISKIIKNHYNVEQKKRILREVLQQCVDPAIINRAILEILSHMSTRELYNRYRTNDYYNLDASVACNAFIKIFFEYATNLDIVSDVSQISVIGYLSYLYNINPVEFHDLIRTALIKNANPNRGTTLPLVEIAKSYTRIHRIQYPETIHLLLTYGADPNLPDVKNQTFWNLVNIYLIDTCDIIYDIKAVHRIYGFLMQKLLKSYASIMQHPDRLRMRILSIQDKLNADTYDLWLKEDPGWLEYFGIYDLNSFLEKMHEYARYMD